MTNTNIHNTNWGMKLMDKSFIYDVMSIPTYTNNEFQLVGWIEQWADQRGIGHERDAFGNLYLTKGSISEGEYYPCLTSHLDTVQRPQEAFANEGRRLDIITEKTSNGHRLRCDGFGIGADCKSGVAICLAIIEQAEAAKCCFFVQEEAGCLGSKAMDAHQLDAVGYVLGFDSPEHNRAAWSCCGTPLFDGKFFKNCLRDICANYGLTNFYSEPPTDVMVIRQKTNIACTNFGNGGYKPHSPWEYCIAEEMDLAAQMGLALVKQLGKQRFICNRRTKAEDAQYLKTLGDNQRVFAW